MTGEETLPIVNTKLDFVTGWLSRALVMLPIVSLALSALFWLKYGIDMPYWDDWRKYTQGYMGSFDLEYLFTPENDTLYPVGKFLDSLAFRVLGGNSIPYQFLSMLVVLGGLLLLQWRLLVRCADSFLVAACAFSLTIFMLQPDSYWGLTDLAYHQAIPLLCILGALNLVFVARWQNTWHALLIFVLGVVSGLTYISGAFATLTLGIALLVIRPFIEGALKHKLLAAGIASLGAGLLCVIVQLIGIAELQEQSGRYSFAPIAYPWMSDFWLYMLGKIARSLLLPVESPAFSLITISLIVALVLVLAIVLISQTLRQRIRSKALPSCIVFLSLLAVIFIYLGIISAGRAIVFRPANSADALGAFSWGYHRFHFFWVTLLWPWLALILLNGLFNIRKPGKTFEIIIIVSFALLIVLSIKYSQLMAHEPYYQQVVTPRLEGLECIRANFQNEGDFSCTQVQGVPPISSLLAIENARRAGASFVRDINFVPVALSATAPLYRLSEHRHKQGHKWSNAQPAAGGGDGALDAADDPGLLIDLENRNALLNCRTLEVNARFSATQADIAQLFYLLPGKTGFSEADSQLIQLINNSEPQTVSFRVSSDSGFLDKLRFDPVTVKQSLLIDDLEVRCRAHITQPFAGKVGANG